jgi:enoyl-CoA hydratase/carnithine racemase
MTGIVLTERRGPAFHITLNRPDRRNAINKDLIDLVAAGFREAAADTSVRVIVLTGAGDKAFCAGGDLAPGGGFNVDFSQPRSPYGDLLRLSQDCPLPIIVAVNGHCIAGGMGFLALADIAVSVESAKFGLPEVKIGLFPMQVMSLLGRLVPPRLVREWSLTGELFDAATAKEAGLLNHVVPAGGLEAKVDALVASLAARSPSAIRRGKYALRVLDGMSFEQAIAFTEGQLSLMTLTGDAKEGFASFNEKREPNFKGN